ncbi:MAG TPA: hypothetical protein VFQ35_22525 [Polyangiaceae bacterium]|nr:hypothetical protein [Polyangiaceae bacterium]
MGRSPLHLVATLGLAVGVLCARPASAAPQATPTQIREAAEAFDRGREAYKNEDYVTAAEQFERADAQAGSPTALEYAIRSRDRASQLDRAATLAALVAKRYPENASLEKLASDVQGRARSSLYELSVQCGEPCDLALDDKIVPGAADLTRTLFLQAGHHSLRAGFGNETGGSEEIEATPAGKGQVSFARPAPADVPPPVFDKRPPTAPEKAEPKSSGWSPAVFWVGAGVTGALGIASIWSGVDTLNNPGKDAIREKCGSLGESCPEYQEGLSNQRRTNILLGATAGVGVATILIGVLATDWGSSTPSSPETPKDEIAGHRERRRKRSQAKAVVVPWVSFGSGALVGAEGRF